MKYPFDEGYQPPFPALPVAFTNPDEGLRTTTQSALVDTGSDGTMVPTALLEEILAPALNETRVRSHWGEWRAVQMFLVDIELDNLRLPGMFVVGDNEGVEIVLGRNVLNRLYLALDGPRQLTEIR